MRAKWKQQELTNGRQRSLLLVGEQELDVMANGEAG